MRSDPKNHATHPGFGLNSSDQRFLRAAEVKRRDFLPSSLYLTMFARYAHAQSGPGPVKLAILSPDLPASADLASGSPLSMFLQVMQDLSCVEWHNLRTKVRFAVDRLDRLLVLAAELVAWQPNVIYTYITAGA